MTARVTTRSACSRLADGPNAAAVLDVDTRGRAHTLDQRQVHGRAALRAVEIHDVQPLGTELAILPGQRYGVDRRSASPARSRL